MLGRTTAAVALVVVVAVIAITRFSTVAANPPQEPSRYNSSDGVGFEQNSNRPGSDYHVRRLSPLNTWRDCRADCLYAKDKCRAWTYVRPGVQDRDALCYLKQAVPPRVPDVCCVSGVTPDKSRTGFTQEPGGFSPGGQTPGAPPLAAEPPLGLPDPAEPPSTATSAQDEPRGAIGDKYAKLGGSNSGIGPVLGGETDAPHGGRCQRFQHGSICWHPEIGEAFTVWGDIHKKWVQHRGVEYGYPTTDELTTPDGRGRFNHFRAMQLPGRPEASIYWTPQTGAAAVWGAIRDAWAQQGWERGPLGYPTSDEHQDGKYRRVNFERGFIRWAPDTGIEVMK